MPSVPASAPSTAGGAILIAGTGSAGLIYREGRLRTCSGRGFPISDLGSGAWLGLRAIQQSLLCHDGILPPAPWRCA